MPTAACCLLSARYPHPEQAPASGPPPCPPLPPSATWPQSNRVSALHSAFFLHVGCTVCLLASSFFCRRSAGSHVRPKLASCRAPSRTLILRLHAHLCGSPPMAAPQREMSDRPTVCQSLRATRPVVTAAVIRLLPSLHTFPLHTVACIPLLNCYFWRFDGEACIDLACMGQTPWPTSHATKSPVAGRSTARITAKPGSTRRLHAASSHGPSWALFAKAHVPPKAVPWPLP